ncbi:hypothetical protein IWQ60_000702 [Tieghemiomyces parasiticus]|uniref:Uncharacterized protein n=1 Tax=Tieghemiomyces parasiticus TaxID=78921 RepID=A0A9W8AEB5_9FUNG|nr:hypothetical protein IWQ60_000702 [Tieghemiomyces parasiticus]
MRQAMEIVINFQPNPATENTRSDRSALARAWITLASWETLDELAYGSGEDPSAALQHSSVIFSHRDVGRLDPNNRRNSLPPSPVKGWQLLPLADMSADRLNFHFPIMAAIDNSNSTTLAGFLRQLADGRVRRAMSQSFRTLTAEVTNDDPNYFRVVQHVLHCRVPGQRDIIINHAMDRVVQEVQWRLYTTDRTPDLIAILQNLDAHYHVQTLRSSTDSLRRFFGFAVILAAQNGDRATVRTLGDYAVSVIDSAGYSLGKIMADNFVECLKRHGLEGPSRILEQEWKTRSSFVTINSNQCQNYPINVQQFQFTEQGTLAEFVTMF